jgi:hypothetical protein
MQGEGEGQRWQRVTVTTATDVVAGDGKLSLREAVAQANATAAADSIRFTTGLEGQTLTLTRGELQLSQDAAKDGDGDNNGSEVTISGGGASRIFNTIGGETDVTLADLTLAGGSAFLNAGGAVLVGGGSLDVAGCTIRDSVGYNGKI